MSDLRSAKIALDAALKPGLAPVVSRSRVEKAIQYLNGALRFSVDRSDRYLAFTDLSRAYNHLLKLTINPDSLCKEVPHIRYMVEMAVQSCLGASKERALSSVTDHNLSGRVEEVVNTVISAIGVVSREKALDWFTWLSMLLERNVASKLCTLPVKSARMSVHAGICQLVYFKALRAWESTSYKKVISLLDGVDANFRLVVELREAGAVALDTLWTGDVNCLEEDFRLLRCAASSGKMLSSGDVYFEKFLTQEAEMLMGYALLALDDYCIALAQASSGGDVEAEAIANARLGKLYARILRLPERAHKHYVQAVRLANALSPTATLNKLSKNGRTRKLEKRLKKRRRNGHQFWHG